MNRNSNDSTDNSIDKLAYTSKTNTNQLSHVTDHAIAETGLDDIKTQSTDNHVYNKTGQYVIDVSDGTYEGGVSLIIGNKWERIFSSGNLFKNDFSNLVQFWGLGDGASLTSNIRTDISLDVYKQSNPNVPVKMKDYTFKVNVSSISSGMGVDRSNTKAHGHLTFEFEGEKGDIRLHPFQPIKGQTYITSTNSLGLLSYSFGIKRSVQNMSITVHLIWSMDNGSASAPISGAVLYTLGNIQNGVDENIFNFK
ncbi:MAG: hypothetical protein HRT66_06980 [Flavobacteriaceae bacterium]|nr:hypothetical protein [Flavobacteriaceae bacterium]